MEGSGGEGGIDVFLRRIYENLGLDTRARHSRRSVFVFWGLEVGGGRVGGVR